ncbi:ribonuclease P protein component [Variovorax sp. H27-G14]|uniref:ribonuclease P protein component n=1 Tax=Variovorax sp. H27-G14 TaxID=3111914 RepID=UPI0038FC389D
MQRLKTRAQFQAALAGATVARTAHFALHRCALDLASSAQPLFVSDDVWLGAMVPKRWARRAVTRNAIKRQIYAVSAAPGVALPRAAHVVRLRAGFDRKEFVSATSDKLKAAVRAELQQLLARAARPPAPAPRTVPPPAAPPTAPSSSS